MPNNSVEYCDKGKGLSIAAKKSFHDVFDDEDSRDEQSADSPVALRASIKKSSKDKLMEGNQNEVQGQKRMGEKIEKGEHHDSVNKERISHHSFSDDDSDSIGSRRENKRSLCNHEMKPFSDGDSVHSESQSHQKEKDKILYDKLDVEDHIRDLFKLIDSYQPVELEIETPLKCFIPGYIPAIGDVDPMIKIPRPDSVPDGLGITSLDEPIPSNQSNAAVIELQLRNFCKRKNIGQGIVRSINDAANKSKEIDEWIKSVEEITATKTISVFLHQKKMPTMEDLMQAWPTKIQDELKRENLEVPCPDIALSAAEYSRVLCSLFGIPVYEGFLVESIHTLFSLFIEVQSMEKTNRSLQHTFLNGNNLL